MTKFYNLPIVHPDKSHYSRAVMPQIKDDESFIVWLKNEHKVHTVKIRINPKKLKPTQNEINLSYVFSIIQAGLNTERHPLIVASDDHILDGHNRWYSALILCEPVTILKVDREIHSLIHLGLSFPDVKFASVQTIGDVTK